MKKIISNLLSSGFTKSKKPMEEFTKYLFILKYILKVNEFGWITCNDNAFWKAENIQEHVQKKLEHICKIQIIIILK